MYQGEAVDIAFFVWEYPPRLVGGLGTYAQYITRELVKMGHTITVLTLNPGNLKTRELIAGVEIHRPLLVDVSRILPDVVAEDIRRWGPGLNFFAKIFLYNVLSASKLVNDLIKRESRKFDILSVHDWLSIIGGIIVKSELGIPMAFHIHSTEQGRTLGDGSKTIIELERKGGEDANIIVTVSNAMKEELTMLGYPTEKIRVVWNGVDPEKYNPHRIPEETCEKIRDYYGIGYDEFMVLYIGRLAPVKGVDKLLMAMPHVLEKHPNTKLVILGKGELEQHVKDLVNSLKLEDKVKLRFEFVSEEERIEHYAACDVAVFPSLYEPFGIVALEAMSMEKPLVVGAKGVSGFREIVIPSGPRQCGIHVNPYDAADIAWGINCILDDPQRGEWMGRNGRKRVLEEFTWTRAAERTIRVYEEVLS